MAEDDPTTIGRYMRPKGVSVLKISGTYLTQEYPTDIQIAEATEVYMGGMAYIVSDAQAVALVAAGYQVDTPDSVGAVGSGDMPPQSYFNPSGGDPGAIGFVPWVANHAGVAPVDDGDQDLTTPSYNDV
jgi:hypothetical protein